MKDAVLSVKQRELAKLLVLGRALDLANGYPAGQPAAEGRTLVRGIQLAWGRSLQGTLTASKPLNTRTVHDNSCG